MNDNLKNTIDWWILREKKLSKKAYDPFVRFFIYYMCLDAHMVSGSGADNDSQKLDWLKDTNNPLKQLFVNKEFNTSDLGGLMQYPRIEDMRPNHRGEYKDLQDISNFNQVIDFIYQIRCNLFHGQKSPANDKDSTLVECAGRFLSNWIRWAHLKM